MLRSGSGRLAPETRPEVPVGAIDLASLAPHERQHPVAEFSECLARVLKDRGGSALGYGPTLGDARLREALAERLSRRGLSVSAANILVVGGAQQGLDLLFRSFLSPGDAVLTESPSYHMALELLRFHEARIAGVSLVTTTAGLSTLDFAALETEMERRPPTLAYVMPTFQNPTGLTLDTPSRRRLASACREAGTLLVEDDYEADMAHDGAPPTPIAALPEAGDVAYVGTLSKALFPGLRVGWVVAKPDLLARLAQVKRISDLSGAMLLQAVAAELITSGTYERHLAAAVASTGRRMSAMVAALERALPTGARVTAPRGGHVLWLEAPVESGRSLATEALRQGVVVTPGEAFLPEDGSQAAVRISVAHIEEPEVDEAAARLARAVAACMEEGRSRPAFGADMEQPVQV